MAERVRGCLANVGCLTVLVLAVGAGWLARDRAAEWWRRLETARLDGSPSEELALRAEEKLRRLAEAGAPARERLGEAELQSLVLFRVAPALPAGIESPAVEVRDSALVVTALLRLDRMRGVPAAEMLRGFLTDSAHLTAELVPALERPGEARVEVRVLQAGSLVLPPVVVGPLLQRLQLPGTRARARSLIFPVPTGVTGIRVVPGGLEIETGGATPAGASALGRAARRGAAADA